jgi:hypothetical protein
VLAAVAVVRMFLGEQEPEGQAVLAAVETEEQMGFHQPQGMLIQEVEAGGVGLNSTGNLQGTSQPGGSGIVIIQYTI